MSEVSFPGGGQLGEQPRPGVPARDGYPGLPAVSRVGGDRDDGPVVPDGPDGDWDEYPGLPDGDWDERFFTGTGFPLDFMIRYHLYRLHFPLLALGRLRERLAA